MLEKDAIGPMEKIYVECVYHTGGLRVRWALGLNHSHICIYMLMKHEDMRLMTEPQPPSPQPALGTPSVCKTRYFGEYIINYISLLIISILPSIWDYI